MPGGVCAVLDYEVDQMAEFVAEMAVRVVMPLSSTPVTSSFRKFVSQILSSTRLPKSTILLGMNYLAKRVNTLKQNNPAYTVPEGQVWRMLTVSLLLGSKFLDDNTFQNRSWSEVSGIAVAELNSLEHEWLEQSGWRLYVNLDFSEDYKAWLNSWDEWLALKAQASARATRERLVPTIDTNLNRYNGRPYSSFVQQQTVEYERYEAIKRNDIAHQQAYGSWQWQQAAPLTPPDSGYGTPEYINSATSANARYNDWFSQAATNAQWNRYQQPSHNYYGARHNPPPYSGHYGYSQTMWEHGVAECNCASCVGPAAKPSAYFAHPSFGQAVMG
ncbi:Meiotically up-regulated gene 80 protein [Colletotrichum orbiculare MAFF 240422]|uniref:Meiotically up-regulated gene 80 protein n=2 Tax=Colletotrichum orbiculare species complex TaxID=2707354 RepID=N4VTF4_COLOR|nr:Meiotically up-regulated gene 80 protein [Colletotrichum orbiculare MAFF 240422]TDZ37454.1 Meiotically up-regulated gene 80 protein [Colletotrichum spinosum]